MISTSKFRSYSILNIKGKFLWSPLFEMACLNNSLLFESLVLWFLTKPSGFLQRREWAFRNLQELEVPGNNAYLLLLFCTWLVVVVMKRLNRVSWNRSQWDNACKETRTERDELILSFLSFSQMKSVFIVRFWSRNWNRDLTSFETKVHEQRVEPAYWRHVCKFQSVFNSGTFECISVHGSP